MLQTLEMPTATQIRASQDHAPELGGQYGNLQVCVCESCASVHTDWKVCAEFTTYNTQRHFHSHPNVSGESGSVRCLRGLSHSPHSRITPGASLCSPVEALATHQKSTLLCKYVYEVVSVDAECRCRCRQTSVRVCLSVLDVRAWCACI
jgi:hypothetical protein